MAGVYDFRVLHLRVMSWLVRRELARGRDDEGQALFDEIEDAIEVEKIDAEAAIHVAEMGRPVGDPPGFDDHLKRLQVAREAERPPVHGAVAIDGGEDVDDGDGLIDIDARCTKCGIEMAIAVAEGVTPLPICPYCRANGSQKQE